MRYNIACSLFRLKKKRSRGRIRSGLTPSPERLGEPEAVKVDEIFTRDEDIEKGKQLIQDISTQFHERAMEMFNTPDTTSKVREAIERSYIDYMKSNEVRKEVMQLIQKEQDKLKQAVLFLTKESREAGIKAEMEFRENQIQVVKQEAAIKNNERLILQLQADIERLRGINALPIETDEERLAREERKKGEEEEQARLKNLEELRQAELKKKEQEEAEEEEKRKLLANRKTSRQSVSFSMFGGF